MFIGMGVAHPDYFRRFLCTLRGRKGRATAQTVHVNPMRVHSMSWMTMPVRSFGSNQVALGGMMLPVSAMRITCSIVTG